MKRILKITALMWCLFIFLIICFCVFNIIWPYNRAPNEQPGTVWVSYDGRAVLKVGDDELPAVVATIYGEYGEERHFNCYMFRTPRLALEPEDGVKGGEELWYGEYWTKDFFTAYVVESTYFAEGDTLFFHKIER